MLNKFKNLNIDLYESIEDLPIDRYNKFNRYALMDSGLGSSINDTLLHLNKVVEYIKVDSKDNAIKAVNNIIENVQLIQGEHHPIQAAYVCLIKSINGKPFNDLSESNINRTLDMLKEVQARQKEIVSTVDKIKKKSRWSLSSFSRIWSKT